MSEPIYTYRLRWWERRLVKLLGKKVFRNGKFIGWEWNGRFFF